MHSKSAPQDDVLATLESLKQAYTKFTDAHSNYVDSYELNDDEKNTADIYLKGVQKLHDVCITRFTGTHTASGSWNTSNLQNKPSDMIPINASNKRILSNINSKNYRRPMYN